MKLYDTMTREARELATIEPGKVSIYSCGPTVYDYPHVGNWSGYIYWDTLVRTFGLSGLHVNWYMNITDVGHLVGDDDGGEDKLEKGAKREGKSAWDVAEFYTKDFIEGLDKLKIAFPKDHLTKATDNIDVQIDLIKKLEEKGFTYKIEDGIYFDTTKLKDYGKLARLDIEGLKAGARVAIKDKKNPTDFALWKFSPTNQKRDMEWESPWGKGFPGWHIECSAMAMKYLGDTIDIHTGGIDHIAIHHTNEIAQTETATGKPFVNYWLHNNFLMIDFDKISKSLNNGITLQDLEKKGFSLMAYRLMILQSHYRTQSNFTWEILEAAQNRLLHWQAIADLRFQDNENEVNDNKLTATLEDVQDKALKALQDDLDTPSALLFIEQGIDALKINSLEVSKLSNKFFKFIDQAIGINLLASKEIDDHSKALIESRRIAKQSKDFEKSDEIRKQLERKGIAIQDNKDSQIWKRLSL